MADEGLESNIAICRALGLDPTDIKRGGLTLRLTAAGPEVDVTYMLRNAEGKRYAINAELATELKRYRLVPIEGD